jgi:hypothetical protein
MHAPVQTPFRFRYYTNAFVLSNSLNEQPTILNSKQYNQMKKLSVALLSALIVLVTACEKIDGKGPIVTETRDVSGFSGIDFRIGGEVYYKKDSAYRVEVSAQRNILDKLETYVSDGKLVIKSSNGIHLRSYKDVRVLVSGPQMNSLRVSGSGDIITSDAFTTGSMDMDVSGSGKITVTDMTAGYADVKISGSGDIKIHNGAVTEERLKISGSGSMDLSNVTAANATTTTSGSGDIRLQVSQHLKATISGSGSVYYKGNPIIDTKISGSGKVTHM